jgi:flagellin-like hook-associated protein FlgL
MAFPYLTIFLAGTHKTAHAKKVWTGTDLETVLTGTAANSPAKIPFTAQLDNGTHPADNLPIFGFADKSTLRKVTVNGADALQIQPCEFAEGLLEKLKDTPLNKMSVRLDSADFSLEHICFVERPAVAEVPPLSAYDFAANEGRAFIDLSADATSADFADGRMGIVGRSLRSLRDWMIGKFGLDETNKAIADYGFSELEQYESDVPQWLRDAVMNINERIGALEKKTGVSTPQQTMILANDYNFSDDTHNATPTQPTEADMKELDELRQVVAKQSADFAAHQETAAKRETALEAQNAALQAQMNAMRDAAVQRENADFVDALVREGKVLPVERDLAVQDLTLAAKTEGKINFSGVEKDMLTAKKELLSQRPVIAPLGGHIATKGKTPEQADFSFDDREGRQNLVVLAKKLAAEKGIDFTTAVNEIAEKEGL